MGVRSAENAMHRRISTLLLIPVALVCLLIACSPYPAPPGLTPVPTLAPETADLTPVGAVAAVPTSAPASTTQTPGDPTKGAAIFAQNCTACHGQQAQGGVGPALKNNTFIKTGGDQSVFQTIANGRPGTAMPGWLTSGKLTASQINDVIAFLKTLQQ